LESIPNKCVIYPTCLSSISFNQLQFYLISIVVHIKTIENAHLLTRLQFSKLYPNELQAHIVRAYIEDIVDFYIYGQGEGSRYPKIDKPSLSSLLFAYIRLYADSLPENRGYLDIGISYALKSTEGNIYNGVPIYPQIDRNINCNWSYEAIVAEIQKHT